MIARMQKDGEEGKAYRQDTRLTVTPLVGPLPLTKPHGLRVQSAMTLSKGHFIDDKARALS